MRIEIRKQDHTVIELDCEAVHIEIEPIEFSHEFFRLKDDKGTLKLFYHGCFVDDVSKVFEYQAGSGVFCKDEQARYVITQERGMCKGPSGKHSVDADRGDERADKRSINGKQQKVETNE